MYCVTKTDALPLIYSILITWLQHWVALKCQHQTQLRLSALYRVFVVYSKLNRLVRVYESIWSQKGAYGNGFSEEGAGDMSPWGPTTIYYSCFLGGVPERLIGWGCNWKFGYTGSEHSFQYESNTHAVQIYSNILWCESLFWLSCFRS